VKKRGFAWVFLFIYPPIYPSFTTPTGHIFSAILTLKLNGSCDVFLQPLGPFGGREEIARIYDVKSPPKPSFLGREPHCKPPLNHVTESVTDTALVFPVGLRQQLFDGNPVCAGLLVYDSHS